jgi:hypothetical protein
MNLNEMRQHYLSKAPYLIDGTIPEGMFATDEVAAIN